MYSIHCIQSNPTRLWLFSSFTVPFDQVVAFTTTYYISNNLLLYILISYLLPLTIRLSANKSKEHSTCSFSWSEFNRKAKDLNFLLIIITAAQSPYRNFCQKKNYQMIRIKDLLNRKTWIIFKITDLKYSTKKRSNLLRRVNHQSNWIKL